MNKRTKTPIMRVTKTDKGRLAKLIPITPCDYISIFHSGFKLGKFSHFMITNRPEDIRMDLN